MLMPKLTANTWLMTKLHDERLRAKTPAEEKHELDLSTPTATVATSH
jgi:hypothetical protein